MSVTLEENGTDTDVRTKRVRNRVRPTSSSSSVHTIPMPEESEPAQNILKQTDLEPEGHGCCGYLLIGLFFLFFILLSPLLIWVSFTVIQSYERGVVLRLGKLRKHNGSTILGSGVQFVLPCLDKVIKVDMRTVTVNIPPQDVLTRDSVTVGVDAVVYMHVVQPAQALLCVENWKWSTQLLAVSSLRTMIGNYRLAELLSCRDQIDKHLKAHLDEATDPWGIKVERVEIKDVSLPQDMQRAMAAEAQATQAAQAKIIEAKGELDSAEMIQEAAKRMSSAPGALQLRYLQTLSTIATEQNSTIIFPLPMEFLSMAKSSKQSA